MISPLIKSTLHPGSSNSLLASGNGFVLNAKIIRSSGCFPTSAIRMSLRVILPTLAARIDIFRSPNSKANASSPPRVSDLIQTPLS